MILGNLHVAQQVWTKVEGSGIFQYDMGLYRDDGEENGNYHLGFRV